ncbi:MAG: hypothetical protein LBM07_02510 [Culturomica sp.]|jgi:uracil-DNA glycosylase|nr:hypothetical protein [Culturomica sp.]
MGKEEIVEKAKNIRDELVVSSHFCKYNEIDKNLGVIPPFIGKEEIKLIIIGQDPTVKNEVSREKIKTTLNLDKGGALKNYIEAICKKLGFSLNNVYATNIFKYFYSQPPAKTMCVLYEHLFKNLELLKEEIANSPNAIIVTLGEPVLQLLTTESKEVKKYWGYSKNGKETKCDKTAFKQCTNNKLGRTFYVLPHQPSISREFYKNNLDAYLGYIKICENL